MKEPRKIIIGVVGHDIHVVANRILHRALLERGYFVCNLSTNNKVEDFVDAALEVEAHAVLVASLNGESEYWCRNFRDSFVAAGLDSILLYVGGNLIVGERDPEEVRACFEAWGFDRVYYGGCDFTTMLDELDGDLGRG